MPDHTIAENLTRLTTARTDIATAITGKGGTVATGAGFEDFPTAIGTIPGGSAPTLPEKDVNFYDCDGSVLYAYTTQEFLALTELPVNPTRTGLVSQGWNWDLADAKTHVTTYGKLDIGQNYVTDDGKSRIYIHCDEPMWVNVARSGSSYSITVDFGDSTEPVTWSGSGGPSAYWHKYSLAGDYIIKITTNNANAYNVTVEPTGIVTKVELGSSPVAIQCYYPNVKYISIPNTVMSAYNDVMGFSYAPIVILGAIPTLQNYAKCSITNVKRISLPNTNRMQGSTNVGWTQNTGQSLTRITFCPSAYYFAYQLHNLKFVGLRLGTTSISNNAFSGCYELQSIIIPSSVTTIGTYAFAYCSSLASIKFLGTTPPTVSDANAWTDLPTTCTIYVPTGSLTAYTTASNYPDPNTYTYVEY